MHHLLDDIDVLRNLDSSKGMFALADSVPDQVRRSIADFKGFEPEGSISSVIVTGLGGSAISGDYLRALFDHGAKVPLQVVRDYSLPAWVGANTLVICVSYSGNTEETLSAYADARSRGAKVVIVSSGGQLTELAREGKIPLLPVPGGMPPRAALGHIFTTLVLAAEHLGLIQNSGLEKIPGFLDGLVCKWKSSVPLAENSAKKLAEELFGKLPVIYGLGGWQSAVATRWKCQIEENAKLFAFAGAVPEMDHNEIEPWASDPCRNHYVGVLIESGAEIDRMRVRADVTAGILQENVAFHRVAAGGSTLLESVFAASLYGDYVSLYLALLANVDPGKIDTLERIKRELAS